MNGNHDQSDADSINYAIELKRGDFKPEKCFYPQTLISKIHPVVKKFFEMDSESIACRYAQINPVVNIDRLRECLNFKPKYFKWSGKFISQISIYIYIFIYNLIKRISFFVLIMIFSFNDLCSNRSYFFFY